MTLSKVLTDKLKDPTLATDKSLVGNDWLATSQSGKTFEVTNPATGEVIAVLPDLNKAEVTKAIDAAIPRRRLGRRRPARSAPQSCAS
jgi:succinate-semialdehyde dehydrogenase / glutarate-semialdehyde dehydrogenase